jgi:hypothetical protein
MNSVGIRRRLNEEPEDFFTSLTFSTLLGELSAKNALADHMLPMTMEQTKVRIKADFDRVWNAREDHHFLNKIFN